MIQDYRNFIPVAAPSITKREGELAQEAALTAWGAGHYAFNTKFEKMMADYVGVSHAASLPTRNVRITFGTCCGRNWYGR